jgi:hypothetical protein
MMIKHALLLMVVALAIPRIAVADKPKLVVVVAKGSSLTSISRGNLKRCFLGDSVETGGRKLVPFNAPPESPERAGFDQAVLGMSPDEIGRMWTDRKVRAQSPAPRSLPVGHLARVVAKFPYAISYVPANQLTADLQPVAIDGIPHTDARYAVAVQ